MVLLRPVGGPEVMYAQLAHLLDMTERPWFTLHVIPLSAGARPGMMGSFTIAGFEDLPDIMFLDRAIGGHVSDRPEDVEAATRLFDDLRAAALPPRESANLIRETMDRWKTT